MNSQAINIEVNLTSQEVESKLRAMSVEDFDKARQSPDAVYWGDITSHSFKIRHVRYSPLSESSDIKGEIVESLNNRTIIKLDMDIKEPFVLIRKMYYGTLIPIGVIIMLLSILVMWGTEFQWQSLLLSSSFIVVAFIAVMLYKTSLSSMKKRELKDFISRIDGHVISESN